MGATILMLALILLGGLWLIVGGLNMLRGGYKASARLANAFGHNRTSWRKKLVAWQIVSSDDSADALLNDVIHSWSLIFSPAAIGTGIATVLLVIGYFVVAIVATRGLLLASDNEFSNLGTLLYLGFLVGSSVGYALGFWYARHERSHTITYGDLRRRRLSDYRSMIVRLGFVFIAGCYCLVFLLAPELEYVTRIHIIRQGYIETAPWVVWLFPAIMLITVLVGEAIMTHIATLPRLLITTDPAIASRADDMLRTTAIAWVQIAMLYVTSNLLIGLLMLTRGLPIVNPLCRASVGIATMLWLLLFILSAFAKGRLGGTKTGWPWQSQIRMTSHEHSIHHS
jgi:hypothetical protein